MPTVHSAVGGKAISAIVGPAELYAPAPKRAGPGPSTGVDTGGIRRDADTGQGVPAGSRERQLAPEALSGADRRAHSERLASPSQ